MAATFPPGYKGDVTKEAGRRPGTDGERMGNATPAKKRVAKNIVAKNAVAKKASSKRAPAKQAAAARSKPRA